MYGYGYYLGKPKISSGNSGILFSDTFNRTSLGSDWTLTNTGSSNGLTFSMATNYPVFSCAHTAATTQQVINNNISSTTTFSGDYVVMTFEKTWTDPNPTNAQFEVGLAWDNTNRIYFGNNSANNLNFIRIKINNVNVFSLDTLTQSLDAKVKIIYDKANDLVSFYTWNGSAWAVAQENIDISPYTLPASDPFILFGAGAENSSRSGGDSSSMPYVYVTNYNFSTVTP